MNHADGVAGAGAGEPADQSAESGPTAAGPCSIQSTAIYLRCVELHGRELAESIDYLYGALIDA